MKGDKHHYVPEVYIKRFAINNTGFTNSLVLKPLRKSARAKPTNTSKICYVRDNFKLQTSDHLDPRLSENPYFIEQNAFPYENRELVRIFDLVDRKRPIVASDARKLIKILFSIKRRNPVFIDKFTAQGLQSDAKSVIESVIEESKPVIDSFPDGEQRAQNAVNTFLKNMESEEYVKDIYRKLLFSISEDENPDEVRRLNFFMTLKFTILRTTHAVPFVTSDNPGYTIQEGNKFFNLDLNYVQEFVFPLSPVSLLLIDAREPDTGRTIYKNLIYRQISPQKVNFYNLGTSILCRERIISLSRDQLEITKNLMLKNSAA